MPVLRFTIDEGINTIVREAYWFDEQQEWAMNVLRCVRGLTEEQRQSVINGDAQLVPTDGGTRVQLVTREDLEFKTKLAENRKWRSDNFQKILGRWVRKDHLTEYVEFVVHRYRLTLYHPGLFKERPEIVFRLEEIRRALHDACVLDAGFDVSERDKPVGERDPDRTRFEIELGTFIDEEARRWTHIYKSMPALHKTLPIDIDEIIKRLDKKYGIAFIAIPHCPKCDEPLIYEKCECELIENEEKIK